MGYEGKQPQEGIRLRYISPPLCCQGCSTLKALNHSFTSPVHQWQSSQKSLSTNDTQIHEKEQKRAKQLSSADVKTLQKGIDGLIECTQIIHIASASHSFI